MPPLEGSAHVERRGGFNPPGSGLLASPATQPNEPMAGVIHGTEEQLDSCLHLTSRINALLHGPGPEQPKEAQAVKPMLACAFDCRTKAQMLHRDLIDILANLQGK